MKTGHHIIAKKSHNYSLNLSLEEVDSVTQENWPRYWNVEKQKLGILTSHKDIFFRMSRQGPHCPLAVPTN